MRELELKKNIAQKVLSGHPWVFDHTLDRSQLSECQAGELVYVTWQGKRLGIGFSDPTSPIAVRLLPLSGPLSGSKSIDTVKKQLAHVIERAISWRLIDPRLTHTSGIRLTHGENDHLPGLVIDLYDTSAVVCFDGQGAREFWSNFVSVFAVVKSCCHHHGRPIEYFWEKVTGARSVPKTLGAPEVVTITEASAKLQVNLAVGQKTGLFLDQRKNRMEVGALCAGKRVLNLYCYTGGFSLHAGLSGAKQVTSVDISAPAVAAAEKNFAMNGLDQLDSQSSSHQFVVADAFDFMRAAKQDKQLWDVVIVDPPSFARKSKQKPGALRAYRALNALAVQLVGPLGTFVTASCSSRVSSSDWFKEVVLGVTSAQRDFLVQSACGADIDHPTRPGFPEGDYLSLVTAWVPKLL